MRLIAITMLLVVCIGDALAACDDRRRYALRRLSLALLVLDAAALIYVWRFLP